MNCKCTWTNTILAVVIIVFSFVDWYSQWIIVAAAALILIHAFVHKSCQACGTSLGSKGDVKAGKKK